MITTLWISPELALFWDGNRSIGCVILFLKWLLHYKLIQPVGIRYINSIIRDKQFKRLISFSADHWPYSLSLCELFCLGKFFRCVYIPKCQPRRVITCDFLRRERANLHLRKPGDNFPLIGSNRGFDGGKA